MRFSTAAAAALVLAPVSLAGQVNQVWPRELQRVSEPRSVSHNNLDVSPSSLGRKQRNAQQEGGRGQRENEGRGGNNNNNNGNGQRNNNNNNREGQGRGNGGNRNEGGRNEGGRNEGGRNEGGRNEGGRGNNREENRGGGVQRESGRGGNQGTVAPVIIIWTNQGNGAQRQQVNEKVTVTETVTAGQTAVNAVQGASATQTIKVGGPGGLVYSPPNIQMPVGGTVVWEFLSQNHTVTQSSFAKPCEKLEGGFETGFMPNPNNTVNPPPQVAMQVMTDEPLWFKCSQGKHCAQGMVASINAKDGEKSHAAFQELAIKSGGGAAAATAGNSTGSAAKEAPKGTSKEASKEGSREGLVRTTSAFRSVPTSMAGLAPPAAEGAVGSRLGAPGAEAGAPIPEAGNAAAPEAGGAVGSVGAATGGGSVVVGTGTLNEKGVCDCVASCGGEGGSSRTSPGRAQETRALKRRQAGTPCTCVALCGSMGADMLPMSEAAGVAKSSSSFGSSSMAGLTRRKA